MTCPVMYLACDRNRAASATSYVVVLVRLFFAWSRDRGSYLRAAKAAKGDALFNLLDLEVGDVYTLW
jgi:hypothetical protein